MLPTNTIPFLCHILGIEPRALNGVDAANVVDSRYRRNEQLALLLNVVTRSSPKLASQFGVRQRPRQPRDC
jgi:hypothetical protein